ncbi:MAG: ferrochelatase [Rhodospirillaceae bacterium]|nr:ferrochelatase [Rhodospirillaceae bacterium]|tara:strand:+ start:2592 stop:3638 length:1047 start_codon:yes stop_codon:yes gene_type:complete
MKIAVVLYNLGGPDKIEDVQPFLFNLFNDPMIIGVPTPLRWLLAKIISRRRAPIAKEIYKYLGGGSPLLENTRKQAEALELELKTQGDNEFRVFVAMRYWHPTAYEVALKIKSYKPDQIILMPLYPQYSTTTVGSFLNVWRKVVKRVDLDCITKSICCYPREQGFISPISEFIKSSLKNIGEDKKTRILFSAHGLPKKIVDKGDPYQWQVEQSAQAIVEDISIDGLDWVNCYQSRVGPLEWIGPSTEEEIRRAGREKLAVIVVPLAFVSEHSETLVELDIEYKLIADKANVIEYTRAPTVSLDKKFIKSLAKIVLLSLSNTRGICSGSPGQLCPKRWKKCPASQAQVF